MPLSHHTRSGQTLLEMVIAIGIILASVITTVTLIVTTITAGRESQTRIEAANFAREGVEIIRGIRDSNWIKISRNIDDGAALTMWDDDGTAAGYNSLGGTSGDQYYIAAYIPRTGWKLIAETDPDVAYPILYVPDPAGSYYTQDACPASLTCTDTKFNRIIRVQTNQPVTVSFGGGVTKTTNPIVVTSIVEWRDRLGNHHRADSRLKPMTAIEWLYDWQ